MMLLERLINALQRPLQRPLQGQARFLTYAKKPNSALPGYILPKQSSKTSWYKKMLKPPDRTVPAEPVVSNRLESFKNQQSPVKKKSADEASPVLSSSKTFAPSSKNASDDEEEIIHKPKKVRRKIVVDDDDEDDDDNGHVAKGDKDVDMEDDSASARHDAVIDSLKHYESKSTTAIDKDDAKKAKIRERFLKRFDVSRGFDNDTSTASGEETSIETMRREASSRRNVKNIKYTPLEQQYLDIRKKYPDCMLVVEVGYKFRFFEEDALAASKALNIVAYKDKNMFGASIPTQRLNVHVKKLVQLGYKVGIVRQTETAAIKGLDETMQLIDLLLTAAGDNKSAPFQRKLTNIYTRGTFIDMEVEDSLFEAQPSYLVCLNEGKVDDDRVQISIIAVQLATGDIICDTFEDNTMRNELETRLHHISPAEILLPLENLSPLTERAVEFWSTRAGPDGEVVRLERTNKGFTDAAQARQAVFGFYESQSHSKMDEQSQIDLLGPILELSDDIIVCLSALLSYLQEFHLEHILLLTKSFTNFNSISNMILSGTAMSQLEVYQASNLEDDRGGRGSLLWVLNHTKTKFGGRLLRKWIGKPLVEIQYVKVNKPFLIRSQLRERIEAVEDMLKLVEAGDIQSKKLPLVLAGLPDLEKHLSRIHLGRILPSELHTFFSSLERAALYFANCASGFCSDLLKRVLKELPSIKTICQEYLSEMDDTSSKNNDKKIKGVEENLSEILKDIRKTIGRSDLLYTTVAGIEYLVEIKASAEKKVPKDWIKVSCTKAVSRFHTPDILEELKNLEYFREQLAAAAEESFQLYLKEISNMYEDFKCAIQNIALLDCLLALAQVARQPGFVKPNIVDEPVIEVVEGRHPIVESLVPNFVPNDIHLNERCLLITGPNMGGKSSYIRQVALIVLMAQVGSYVPAARATLGVFDAIYTRMGACDDISKGQSTFMKELQETSDILKAATPRSLVIMDELGRGTSTHDGTAIAYATLSHFLTVTKCTTLFVTHYPVLGSLQRKFSPALRCCHMGFLENSGNEDSKYNIGLIHPRLNVARLASLPDSVIEIAKHQSAVLEESSEAKKCAHMQTVNEGDQWKLVGNKHFAAGEFEESVAAYSKAIIKNPSNPIYYTNRANALFKLHKYHDCASDCEKAISLDSKSVKAYYQWGKALVEIHHYTHALACFRKAYTLGLEQRVPYLDDIASQVRKAKATRWEVEDKKRRETQSDLFRYMSGLIEKDRERKKGQISSSDPEQLEEVDQIFDEKLSQLLSLLSVAEEEGKKREVPEAFLGKISFELMTDPVISPSGITYDRTEILQHLNKIGKWDPLARIPISEKDLIPNLALKEVIDEFLDKNGWAADY
ncbi:Mismatch repair protein msh3 [Phlyctochytrium planicorne]|nr:Mismatch repair protein msh3 [Phlyctochytrium planicorne]